MSGTRSWLRSRWLEAAWLLFALANLAAMLRIAHQETIPFHLIWVSLALVYGFRPWRLRTALAVLVVVALVTGAVLFRRVLQGLLEPDELSEVPLMAVMFLVMAWHGLRRQAALRRAHELAEERRATLEREHEFVRDASHALRTPITVARGYGDFIAAASYGRAVAGDIQVVVEELAAMGRIADRLLCLQQMAREDALDRLPTDLADLVARTGRRWAHADRDIVTRPGPTGLVLADVPRLESALDALVENAVSFTAPGGRITVGSRSEGDHAVLEVSDDGPGVPTDLRARVFDRFYRDDTGRDARVRGSGLGLAIVAAIVDAHGGDVELADRPGGGAMFRLRVPRAGARPDAPVPAPAPGRDAFSTA